MIVVVSGIIGIWIAPSGAAAAASSSSASSQGDAEAQRPRTANSNQPPQEKTNKQKKNTKNSIRFHPISNEQRVKTKQLQRPSTQIYNSNQIPNQKERKKERKKTWIKSKTKEKKKESTTK